MSGKEITATAFLVSCFQLQSEEAEQRVELVSAFPVAVS